MDELPEAARSTATLSPSGDASAEASRSPREATRIGRYAVLDVVGEGGMGTVYAVYDDQLDRRVALKVVRTSEVGQKRQRMLREAQALAKLAHPNVVPVFEVGQHDGEMFVAMEYVNGITLARWCSSEPRSWHEVLGKYLEAGRGLRAAHAAGLVHRDFKPHNAMVGDDDRVRVVDFGLAALRGRDALETHVTTERSDGLHASLTESGEVMGTPAYMAPEQFLGNVVDHRSDQFSFCVSLWEALYHERPFQAASRPALLDKMTRGQLDAPSDEAGVPTRLRAILTRGLHAEPNERWPDMQSLMNELEPLRVDPRRRGRIAIVIGAATLTVLLGFVGVPRLRAWNEERKSEACRRDAAEEIAATWNDDARERVRAGLLATGVSYARATADHALPWLDEHADDWLYARAQVCIASDVRGEWDAPIRVAALSCLDERRLELSALVQQLAAPDEQAARSAVTAAAGLQRSENCHRMSWLARVPAPPPEASDAVHAVRAELATAREQSETGHPDAALSSARVALDRARDIGWSSLVAEAEAALGYALLVARKDEESEATLEEAFFTATELGDLETASAAATNLIFVVGHALGRHRDGRRWARHAAAAFAWLDSDETDVRRVAYYQHLGVVALDAGDLDEAEHLHLRGLAIVESALGETHPGLAGMLHNLAGIAHRRGDIERAKSLHERVLALRERWLGPNHPDVATSLNQLANIEIDTGRPAHAKLLAERALAIEVAAVGEAHVHVAMVLNTVGLAHSGLGEFERAIAAQERALAILERELGPDHLEVARMLMNIGGERIRNGEYARAGEAYQRALSILERTTPDHVDVAEGLTGILLSATYRGEFDRALAAGTRALAIRERQLDPADPWVAVARANLAWVYLERGDAAHALPHYERVIAFYDEPGGPRPGEDDARWGLARALLAASADRARAIAQAEKAVVLMRAVGARSANKVVEIERWIAEQRAMGAD